jgi:hypothetical protein
MWRSTMAGAAGADSAKSSRCPSRPLCPLPLFGHTVTSLQAAPSPSSLSISPMRALAVHDILASYLVLKGQVETLLGSRCGSRRTTVPRRALPAPTISLRFAIADASRWLERQTIVGCDVGIRCSDWRETPSVGLTANIAPTDILGWHLRS